MSKHSKKNIPIPLESEKISYRGKIIEVRTQKMRIDDEDVTFEWAKRSPGTRLIIISNNEKLLITREYRNELKKWDYRLPGGKVFDSLEEYNQFLESGGDIIQKSKQAATKEASEEVGIEAKNISHFFTSNCGATIEWDLYYFLIRVNTEKVGSQKLELGENIEVSWYSIEEAKNIALSGNMSEDRSAAVLLRYIHIS